jgi:MurNAc alpha-1-phosphate uridylyltransferase
MFADLPVGRKVPLRPLLDAQMAQQRISAELWPGAWTDVGTTERLAALNASGPGRAEPAAPAEPD